jgi:hypothetical protein
MSLSLQNDNFRGSIDGTYMDTKLSRNAIKIWQKPPGPSPGFLNRVQIIVVGIEYSQTN